MTLSKIMLEPEGKLMLGIILYAKRDFQIRKNRREVEKFLSSNWFKWICDWLGLDRGYTIRKIKEESKGIPTLSITKWD